MVSQPSVCSAMKSRVDVAVFDQQVQQAVEQRQIGARLDLQEQVGRSAVVVRRGSTTISLAPAFRRSAIRRKRIGWQSAMFEPMTKNRSVQSKSV